MSVRKGLVALLALCAPAQGGTPIPGFAESVAVTGLDRPTDIAFHPVDGAMWILGQGGGVWVFRAPGPPELVTTIPVNSAGERGLLGIAFDPAFATNRRVYFYSTTSVTPLRNRVARYTESGDVLAFDALLVDDLFVVATNHNGGGLAFGPDHKLYVGVGENRVSSNSQDLGTPLGKLLRLDTDGTAPADNPFAGQASADARIFAWGLRNPWRFHFDGATGALYVGDVGSFVVEEVDLGLPGVNYHWPICEGACAAGEEFENPIHQYPRIDGAAITMGPVYRARNFPAIHDGKVFYGDSVQGFVRMLTLAGTYAVVADEPFVTEADSPVDIEIGPDGCLYYVGYAQGQVYRVCSTTAHDADFTAAPRSGRAPLTVAFEDRSRGEVTTHLWSFGDGTMSTSPAPSHTYTSPGTYTVTLQVGPSPASRETKAAYVEVNGLAAEAIATGLGPDAAAPPRVRAFDENGAPSSVDFYAYATGQQGVNVGRGDANGSGAAELLTGPGPTLVYGPHVRGWSMPSASPLAKVSLYAYATLRYGVRAEGADVDGDGSDEILTGPGAGPTFGPNVRAFNWDGGQLSAIAKINFMVVNLASHGARVYGGDIEGDGFAEILAAVGPDPAFDPHVRGYNYDGVGLSFMQKVNFHAFEGLYRGVELTAGDVDGDGFDEIVCGPGPGASYGATVRGFDFDGGPLALLPGLDFPAFSPGDYGVLVSTGDVRAGLGLEILATPAAPTMPPRCRGFGYDGGHAMSIAGLDFVADPTTGHGGNVEAGDLGF